MGGKGEELSVLSEEIFGRWGMENPSLEKLVGIIPKIEEGVRVRVFREGGRFFPISKVGEEMVLAHRMVGFSFIPILVVEKPPGKVLEEKKKGMNLGGQFLEMPVAFRQVWNPRRRLAPQPVMPPGDVQEQLNGIRQMLNNLPPENAGLAFDAEVNLPIPRGGRR